MFTSNPDCCATCWRENAKLIFAMSRQSLSGGPATKVSNAVMRRDFNTKMDTECIAQAFISYAERSAARIEAASRSEYNYW